ncbi:hypothetical protein QTG54_015789 [Skeletonema marinoi]|uniref:Uncharacterized protein n=1 Tax=Skeletonema marinoi TaxID=267567 RepID=A0AAD8XUC1_9STRA|nr:hypothetical protein QTG54_015789 [Skeletonema marinoi]
MVHTNKCIACNCGTPNRYMFLRNGQFTNHCFCDKIVYDNLGIEFIHFEDEYEKLSNAFANDKRGHLISVCEDCCNDLLTFERTSALFLGYLTKQQYQHYQHSCNEHAKKLHREGYLIINRVDWEGAGCNFPTKELFEAIFKSKKKRSKIPNGDYGKCKGRMWIPFVEDWGNKHFQTQHRQKITEQLTKLINPDVYYGKIALKNIGRLAPKHEAWVPFNSTGECVLYRGLGLQASQYPHADAHHGAYNLIEAMTNDYSIKVWPKSHMLDPAWLDEIKTKRKHVCNRLGSAIKVNRGQVIIFHSNLIHCGIHSSGKQTNFSNLKRRFEIMEDESKAQIEWFGVGKRKTDMHLTDLSVHMTIDCKIGRLSVSDYECDAVEVFNAWEITSKEDKDAYKKTFYAFKEEINARSLIYDEMIHTPWQMKSICSKFKLRNEGCMPNHPVVSEADIVLEHFFNGKDFATVKATKHRHCKKSISTKAKSSLGGSSMCVMH